jgi:replicative DNA helicase
LGESGAVKERLPPHSTEGERTILGAAMHFAADHLPVLLDACRESDFYVPVHGELFALLSSAYSRHEAIDALTMRSAALGNERLWKLIDELPVPITADITPVCEQIALLARCRNTVRTAFRLAERGLEPVSDPRQFLVEAQQQLASVIADPVTRIRPKDASELSQELLADLDSPNAPTTFLSTGLRDVDGRIGGLELGSLYVVAGRPGMGKSALAFQMLVSAAKAGHRGLGFTLEMRAAKIQKRLVAGETALNSTLLERGSRRPEHLPRIVKALGTLSALPFALVDEPTITMQQIRALCRAERAKRGLKMVVVDYLQLMSIDGKYDNREQEVASLSREMKRMALELDIAVIACCQLNRGLESRADKHPMLSDLRESGAIEQDADIVMMLYRDEYYNEASAQRGICDLGIAKSRSGETGVVKLSFHPETTSFRDFTRREQVST